MCSYHSSRFLQKCTRTECRIFLSSDRSMTTSPLPIVTRSRLIWAEFLFLFLFWNPPTRDSKMKTLSEMLADWVIRTERLDLRDLLRAPSPSLQFRKVKCSAIISKDLLFSASDPCKQKDGVPRFMSIEREREGRLKKLLWSKNGESFDVREGKKAPKAVGRRRGWAYARG